jgi:hypothetical protein
MIQPLETREKSRVGPKIGWGQALPRPADAKIWVNGFDVSHEWHE